MSEQCQQDRQKGQIEILLSVIKQKLLKWFLFCYMPKIMSYCLSRTCLNPSSYKLCTHSLMYFHFHCLNSRLYSLQSPEQHHYCNTILFQTIMNWSTRNNLVWFKSIGETKFYRYSQVPCSVQHCKNRWRVCLLSLYCKISQMIERDVCE